MSQGIKHLQEVFMIPYQSKLGNSFYNPSPSETAKSFPHLKKKVWLSITDDFNCYLQYSIHIIQETYIIDDMIHESTVANTFRWASSCPSD